MKTKMQNYIHTIRFRVALATIVFTTGLSLLFAGVSYSVFSSYAINNTLLSSEFNLQLVASVIEQDMIQVTYLINWCADDRNVSQYLTKDLSEWEQVETFIKVHDTFASNRANSYVQRLVITDGEAKVLQTGSQVSYYSPLTEYTLDGIPYLGGEAIGLWSGIVPDNDLQNNEYHIPLVQEIQHSSYRRQIGKVYMSISPEIITDPLANFMPQDGGFVTFTIGEETWMIQNGDFSRLESPLNISPREVDTNSPGTQIDTVQLENRGTFTRISYPVGADGLVLAQWVPENIFNRANTLFLLLLLLVLVVIQLLGMVLRRYLYRVLMAPVGKLQNRLALIAGGDFHRAPEIEWPNELGVLGTGINNLAEDVDGLLRHRLDDEKKKRDLEYRMLQNQINPHFLFNTLNSIRWMATIQNAKGIAEMTTAFINLMENIARNNEDMVPLQEELALLNDYCTILQYRYGGTIQIDIAEISDETLCRCLIPRFTLQPLAENAVFHGIEPKGGRGNVWLYITQELNDLLITMADDGVGMSAERIQEVLVRPDMENNERKEKHREIGLHNVHKRLEYAFGKGYGLQIESELGSFTRVLIRIPVILPQEEQDA